MFIDLDEPASLDPVRAGAKAAWLAAGRRVGLPILAGVVVEADVGRSAIALGAATLEPGGSGAARLAIAGMTLDADVAAALPHAVDGLGPCLVVRSSSPLEGDGTWAGAFTSYIDVSVNELPTAIRGCWASAFSPGTIERAGHAGVAPAELSLAVLIQPAIAPEAGGTARLVGDEVQISAVRGSPAPLLQGWDPGVHGRVLADDTIDGRVLSGLLGTETVGEVTRILRLANARTGADSCEWAVVDGRVTILQLGRETARPVTVEISPLPLTDPDGLARLERIARAIRHAPGVLGEAIVHPWALGEGRSSRETAAYETVQGARGRAREDEVIGSDTMDPLAALAAAVELAGDLTAAAWREAGLDDDDARKRAAASVSDLRGTDPLAAAGTLTARPAADEAAAARLHRLLDRVRSGLVTAGAAATEDDAWHVTPDQARAALADPHCAPPASAPRLDPWMPFQAAVILATGQRRIGVGSGPGVGVGRLAVVDDARHPDWFRARDVVLAARPLPHLASLLWDAAAVVTAGGGPGAHLFESARALGLPAVSGIGLDDLLATIFAGGPGSWAIAVEGTSGTVAITPW